MWIFVFILGFVAISVIIIVIARKFPLLASMEIKDSQTEKLKQLKKNIFIARIARQTRLVRKKIMAPENWERVKYLASDAFRKFKDLEEKYRSRTTEAKLNILLKKGRANIADDPEFSEQCFLEVITLDPHNLEAYEALFRIYLSKRSLSEAVELLEFLIKINPGMSGCYVFDIAAAMLESGDIKQSWDYAQQAISFEPENPKYLDLIIELAILNGYRREGEKFLKKLHEVNPENAKIEEFKERIRDLK